MFITFEGMDGSGKSTQSRHLVNYLGYKGKTAVLSREPGGSKIAEEIRNIILNNDLDNITNFFLFNAARADHCRNLIRPLLDKGCIVVCDRFLDSTRVYQKDVVSPWTMELAEEYAVRKARCWPDLTFIIDIPAEVAMERLSSRGNLNSLDPKTWKDHEAIRRGFLELAHKENRYRVIDGNRPSEEVQQDIWNHVKENL